MQIVLRLRRAPCGSPGATHINILRLVSITVSPEPHPPSSPLVTTMLSFFLPLVFGTCLVSARPSKVDGNVGFFDPTAGGGSWLDNAAPGLGEPLNVSATSSARPGGPCKTHLVARASQVVISGLSSPDVLTDDGVINFARAIGL